MKNEVAYNEDICEPTILALTQELKGLLKDTEKTVRELVDRSPEAPETGQHVGATNVFDEITGNLICMRGQIRGIQEMVILGITNKVM